MINLKFQVHNVVRHVFEVSFMTISIILKLGLVLEKIRSFNWF